RAARIVVRRADDQIGEAVAIDVAGRRDASPRIIAGDAALDLEPIRRAKMRQVDDATEPACLAEDHIGRARLSATAVIPRSPDDDVRETIAIDVARRGHAAAREIV